MQLPSLLDLLKAGAHFGHKASKWHPKMEPFIFGARNDVHIVDLEKTLQTLTPVLDAVRNCVASGKTILFVGTKPQAQEIVKQCATECGMPYVNVRWLGGTLTNFNQLRGRVKYYLDLKSKQASGELGKYTKKEQIKFGKEIEDLDVKFSGIATLDKLPEMVFVVDLKHEKTVRAEAMQMGIKIVAICDTNIDPDGIDYCIPGNDDSLKSIELFTKLVSEAVKEGKELAATKAKEVQQKAVADTIKKN